MALNHDAASGVFIRPSCCVITRTNGRAGAAGQKSRTELGSRKKEKSPPHGALTRLTGPCPCHWGARLAPEKPSALRPRPRAATRRPQPPRLARWEAHRCAPTHCCCWPSCCGRKGERRTQQPPPSPSLPPASLPPSLLLPLPSQTYTRDPSELHSSLIKNGCRSHGPHTSVMQSASSIELVAELTEKLLSGHKTEVFAFLQTLPAARAQRIKEKLIAALKKVPAPAPAPAAAGEGSARAFFVHPRVTMALQLARPKPAHSRRVLFPALLKRLARRGHGPPRSSCPRARPTRGVPPRAGPAERAARARCATVATSSASAWGGATLARFTTRSTRTPARWGDTWW